MRRGRMNGHRRLWSTRDCLIEPDLPLRHSCCKGSAVGGLSGGYSLHPCISAAERVLIGCRQLAETGCDRFIRFAVVVSYRALDDPAIGVSFFCDQLAIGRPGKELRIEILDSFTRLARGKTRKNYDYGRKNPSYAVSKRPAESHSGACLCPKQSYVPLHF